jgi:hypothetical protein
MLRHYPGAASGRIVSLSHPAVSAFPERVVGSACASSFFEACSAFTLVAACTLALSPIRDTHSEGFSQFVTSVAAPVASGWSGRRVRLAPTGKRRLVTAHTHLRHWLCTAPIVSVPIKVPVSADAMLSSELGNRYAATRVHHAGRRHRGGLATCGARAAAGEKPQGRTAPSGGVYESALKAIRWRVAY